MMSVMCHRLIVSIFFWVITINLSLPCAYSNPKPAVLFTNKTGDRVKVYVEVVTTPSLRAQGLMHRKSLPKNQGMLFVFPSNTIQPFHMKNTFITLDMIHINANMEIVGIISNTKPLTSTTYQIDAPSMYVLEVNGGWAQKISKTSSVQFINIKTESY